MNIQFSRNPWKRPLLYFTQLSDLFGIFNVFGYSFYNTGISISALLFRPFGGVGLLGAKNERLASKTLINLQICRHRRNGLAAGMLLRHLARENFVSRWLLVDRYFSRHLV